MAISHITTGVFESASLTPSYSFNNTGQAGDLMVITIFKDDTNASAPINAIAWNTTETPTFRLTQAGIPAGANCGNIYTLLNPTTGAHNLTIGYGGARAPNSAVYISILRGVSNTYGNSAGGSSTGTTAPVTVNIATAGSMLWSLHAINAGGIGTLTSSDATVANQDDGTVQGAPSAVIYRVSSATGNLTNTCVWNGSSQTYGVMGLEIGAEVVVDKKPNFFLFMPN